MKTPRNMSMLSLVLSYVGHIRTERRIALERRSLRSEINRRLGLTPRVVAGWRLLKSWHSGGTYTRTVETKPHWNLDIRRNTKPLKKAVTP